MSKPSPRCPMHRRDEMSNATVRRDVQYTVETMCPTHRRDIKSQWNSRDIIYLECPNDRIDKLDKRMQKTIAPVEPVTKHRSNRLASDTPVPYHRCNESCIAQPSEGSQVTPVEPVIPSWRHWCIHHAILQRACQVAEKKVSLAPDEPVVHQCKALV